MRTKVGGVPVDNVSRSGLVAQLMEDFEANAYCRPPRLVFSMNGEGVYKYCKDKRFRELIDKADIVHADGMSIVKAGNRLTNVEFKERVATTDLFHDLASCSVENKLKIYLVGGEEETTRKAIENIKKLYPRLNVVGHHHGFFKPASEEEELLIKDILFKNTDLVFVGLGRPKQEEWCARMQDKLIGVTWLKTCGGLFDFLSGKSRRAPKWMIDSGFEWLYRLALEPRRLFLRYFLTNSYCLYRFYLKKK